MNTAELIQQLAGTFNKDFVQIIACTVDSIDEDAFTCECTAITGNADTKISSVKLNTEANDGFTIIPAIGSSVLVANSTRNGYYVFMYSDIDKVICVIDNNNSYTFSSQGFVWNDGTFGGLINIVAQTTKLNLLVSQLQAQLTLIATGITGAGGSYAPGTLSTFNKNDYEDTNIKH